LRRDKRQVNKDTSSPKHFHELSSGQAVAARHF
jgi:hypothetical protein